jgi:hypothetical protein
MISIVRVRFDTTNDATSVWSDELFDNWMRPLIPYSLGDYWWSSSKALFSLDYTLYEPLVIPDPRRVAPPSVLPRDALVQGCVDAATRQLAPDWDGTDILLLWFAQPTDLFGGGTANVPLSAGGTKQVSVTVMDVLSYFDYACQELGHSFGLNHEIDALGNEYASPYSAMSARFFEGSEFLRPEDPRLPDGLWSRTWTGSSTCRRRELSAPRCLPPSSMPNQLSARVNRSSTYPRAMLANRRASSSMP